jgi:uncharacterized protein
MEPESLIKVVAGWAAERDEIVAAALCGSHATGTAQSDSDIDLVLVCTNRERLLADVSWARDFAPLRSMAFEDYGLVQSVRVAYENGPEVEFGIATVAWVTVPIDPGTTRVMRDGLRILYDPTGRLAHALHDAQSTPSA